MVTVGNLWWEGDDFWLFPRYPLCPVPLPATYGRGTNNVAWKARLRARLIHEPPADHMCSSFGRKGMYVGSFRERYYACIHTCPRLLGLEFAIFPGVEIPFSYGIFIICMRMVSVSDIYDSNSWPSYIESEYLKTPLQTRIARAWGVANFFAIGRSNLHAVVVLLLKSSSCFERRTASIARWALTKAKNEKKLEAKT